jgi:hypothetical protein
VKTFSWDAAAIAGGHSVLKLQMPKTEGVDGRRPRLRSGKSTPGFDRSWRFVEHVFATLKDWMGSPRCSRIEGRNERDYVAVATSAFLDFCSPGIDRGGEGGELPISKANIPFILRYLMMIFRGLLPNMVSDLSGTS